MAIQGLRDTSNFVTDQRPKNWREGILLMDPNGKLGLLGLTSLMKSRKVDDPEFNWWEKDTDNRRAALGANITAPAAGTVSVWTMVSGAKKFKMGDLCRVEGTTEIVRVYTDPTSDTSLTVQRGFSGTTVATLAYAGAGINPNIHCIGSAFEEASLAPTGVNYDPTKRYNYTQIFRSTLEMSRTASKTRLRTGDQVKEAKRECLQYVGIDMERAMWEGIRNESTLAGKPIRTMNGVFNQIDSGNIVTATNATFTMDDLEGWLEAAFRYGSSEKLGICGNVALLGLQKVIRKNSNYQLMQGQKEFGMNVSRLTCPFGDVVLKSHPLWNQQTGGTTAATAYYGQNSWLAILDMSDFTYVYLDGSDLQFEQKLESNGLDGMKSGYIAETSMELDHPLAHYLIKNLVTGAADS